mgnify:CR=1 FL=1
MATSRAPLHLLLALSACWAASAVWAQSYPVTPSQSATARQIAQTGVPLGELATDAPDQYTVRSGDTLWAVSSLFLRSPWRWPELWGMNLDDIRNPHLIYPGQRLVLLRRDGLESGHVLAILKDGQQLVDRTDPTRPQLKLPDERNGLLMVFKTFDKLSYALVLDITDSVRVGDRLAAPR